MSQNPSAMSCPSVEMTTRTSTIDALLEDRDVLMANICDRLLQTQAYAKKHYDGHHHLLEFAVNECVWLRILHHPAQSLVPRLCGKLGPWFAGPF